MAECRDFFQESTSEIRRSSSAAENSSTSRLAESVEEVEAHSLVLTLGLGPPAGSSSSSQVKPSLVYSCLPPQAGFATSTSCSLQTSPLQVDALEGPQNAIGQIEGIALARQRSGNLAFGDAHLRPIFGGQVDVDVAAKSHPPVSGHGRTPSRDQVWTTLQKNGAVFGQSLDQQKEISSMWSRRAASMHAVISGVDGGDAENCLIRRASSIGVMGKAENYSIRRASSSGIPSGTVLRHLSSIDSSLTEKSLSIQDQDKEVSEGLRKRKEMQARRTQEARKRRKILIEEKQLKKCKHGSGLERLGSRQSISPSDKFSLAGTHSDEDGVNNPQLQGGTLDVSQQQESEGKVRESVCITQNTDTKEVEQQSDHQCVKDDKIDGMQSKERVVTHGYESTCSGQTKDGALNHLSLDRMSDSYGECDHLISGSHCVLSSKFHNADNECNHGSFYKLHAPSVVAAHAGARMTVNEEDEGKFSETECAGSSSLQNGFNVLQCVTCSVVTGMAPVTSFPVTSMPKASSSSKDNMGPSFEGNRCSSEIPVVSPLSRTISDVRLPKEEGQSLGVPSDLQAAFPTFQSNSSGRVVSDACNGKLGRQQSMPLGGRLLPQSSSAWNESTLFTAHERPVLVQNGVGARQLAPTMRVDTNAEVTLFDSVRQDKAGMESQLASQQSGVDTSCMSSGTVERQPSGSLSDLPWVTTTGQGPHGRTVSGVMYIVNERQVRLVCSCHGKHMSPAEFVEHSGSSDLSNPERRIMVSPFPSFNRQ